MEFKRMGTSDIEQVKNFFLLLSETDRYTRFRYRITDEQIVRFVDAIDVTKTYVLGAVDEHGQLRGVGELHCFHGHAELAVAVDIGVRGQGLGWAMVERLRLKAQQCGALTMELSCLSDNRPMIKISRRLGMRSEQAGGEFIANMAFTRNAEAHHPS